MTETSTINGISTISKTFAVPVQNSSPIYKCLLGQCLHFNIPAINRIKILAARILYYNKHAITFYTEENAFSILFYGQDDGNGRIFLEILNMDHSPRIEAEDEDDDDNDNDEDDDDKPSKKDLEKAVYGTQPTHENQSPPPDGLNGVLEEMVKCVLVMEDGVCRCCRLLIMMETSTQHNTIITPSMTFLLCLMMICGQLMLKASRLMPILITSTNLPT